MQMYPGAGYKEQHYKVENDDFLFEKNPAMQMNKPDRYHHDDKGPNMHNMMKPDHCNPNHHHGYHHDYKVEKDDFLLNKNSAMHMKKPDHYQQDYKGPNMHNTMKPDHCNPNHHHGYGGYHGSNYPETTICEQEEKKYRVINKYDQYYGTDVDRYYMSNGGNKGYTEHGLYYSDHETKKAPAMWDCKGIDD